MNEKSYNFKWTEHVGDIRDESLVTKFGKEEVINDDAMPSCDDVEDDQCKMFDDSFYSYTSEDDDIECTFNDDDSDGESDSD